VAPPAPEAAQPLEALPAGKTSLAVLPLASSGGDAKQKRLAEGIAEDLIAELGRYRNIAVIAKSSSFTNLRAMGLDQTLDFRIHPTAPCRSRTIEHSTFAWLG
jgi:TolB-like protein